jgi:hypothetical protein
MSYDLWNLTDVAGIFCSGQNEVTSDIQSFDHLQNENSGNFENQSCRELPKLSGECLNSEFCYRMEELWMVEVDDSFRDTDFILGQFSDRFIMVLFLS